MKVIHYDKYGKPRAEDADTVDSIHATTTPTANKLLAMNANAKFPTHTIEGSLTVETGLNVGTATGAGSGQVKAQDLIVTGTEVLGGSDVWERFVVLRAWSTTQADGCFRFSRRAVAPTVTFSAANTFRANGIVCTAIISSGIGLYSCNITVTIGAPGWAIGDAVSVDANNTLDAAITIAPA